MQDALHSKKLLEEALEEQVKEWSSALEKKTREFDEMRANLVSSSFDRYIYKLIHLLKYFFRDLETANEHLDNEFSYRRKLEEEIRSLQTERKSRLKLENENRQFMERIRKLEFKIRMKKSIILLKKNRKLFKQNNLETVSYRED